MPLLLTRCCAILACALVFTSCTTVAKPGRWSPEPLAATAGSSDPSAAPAIAPTAARGAIPWAPFRWEASRLGGRKVERAAILVPVTFGGFDAPCAMQLDTGADLTMLYERTLDSLKGRPGASHLAVVPAAGTLGEQAVSGVPDLLMHVGPTAFRTPMCFVLPDFGDPVPSSAPAGEEIHLGSIGADLFAGRVLIIDYPRRRLAIMQDSPPECRGQWCGIELDSRGRPVLPLVIRGQMLHALFDTGSSLFPIVTSSKRIATLSAERESDSIESSSWGKQHQMKGRPLGAPFELVGHRYPDAMIYASSEGLGFDESKDAVVGNALFWDRTIVIDFAHHRFMVCDLKE